MAESFDSCLAELPRKNFPKLAQELGKLSPAILRSAPSLVQIVLRKIPPALRGLARTRSQRERARRKACQA